MTLENPTIADLNALLVETARGDQSAFARVYAATSGKLYGVALSILRRRDLADDALQEAYLRIWRNASRFDPSCGSPITWMAAIVRNVAIDSLRRRCDIEAVDDESPAIAADSPHPIDEIAAAGQRHRAYAIIKSLDPARRELVIAAYLHGESREQLARRFGKPVNTIKTWLRRTLIDLHHASTTSGAPHKARHATAGLSPVASVQRKATSPRAAARSPLGAPRCGYRTRRAWRLRRRLRTAAECAAGNSRPRRKR